VQLNDYATAPAHTMLMITKTIPIFNIPCSIGMLSLMQLFEFRIKLFVFGMTFWEGEIFIGMKGRERDKR